MDDNWSRDLPFHDNRVLFGHDGSRGLVSFEVEADDRIRIFSRNQGVLSSKTVSFQPFLLTEGEKWLKGFKGEADVEPMEGRASFDRIVRFPSLKALESAKSHLQKKSGRGPSATDAPYLYVSDPIQNYLLLSGQTHFLSMSFGDLRRLQIDIETYCAEGFEFPNAERESDRITAIAMCDSTGSPALT